MLLHHTHVSNIATKLHPKNTVILFIFIYITYRLIWNSSYQKDEKNFKKQRKLWVMDSL